MRDNFSKQTIAEIAKGVGYRCSNPECGRPTVAANAAQNGIVTIGVAAHICAASSGGPRYEAFQSTEVRRSAANGIWLCQNCGKLVDADPKKFTTSMLEDWKRKAQEQAFRNLVAPAGLASVNEASRIEPIIQEGNDADPAISELFLKVHAAACDDLTAFTRGQPWLGNPIQLTLRLTDEPKAPPFSIDKLRLALEVEREIVIESPPGTGKTTTLLQLAAEMLSANSIVPLYFPLGNWSVGSLSLLASLRERVAFKPVSDDDLSALAQRGRVLLLLDGWNEIDGDARKKLRAELEQIRHNWPFVRRAATTRQQTLDAPLSGARVLIEALSYDQQMGIARAWSGADGEKAVADARRTPGVRDLIAIPLYLSALLSGGRRTQAATTKEELLRLFVDQHERASDHAEALHESMLDCHAAILTALGERLVRLDATAMTEDDARETIATTVSRLRDRGQVVGQLEPKSVLDTLVSHHLIKRSGPASRLIEFQHQQFQEWYASRKVDELMRAASGGDVGARTRLRASVFDQAPWEESIYFAVERLSPQMGGAAIVANAIRIALSVDPMLAAEMIYRSTDAVWAEVSAEIMAFVRRWHKAGTVDRAVRFMLLTGRPEFEPWIWPLASSPNRQVQLPTLRNAPRFRPRVLGADIRAKIPLLPEETREHLINLIASESGVDGMDLATELAEIDSSPKVQADVIQTLQFRRADRHVSQLLSKAHDETWALVARRGYAEEIRDPEAAKRLRTEREKALLHATAPLERLSLLLEQSPNYPDRDRRIADAIADADFPLADQQSGGSLYYAQRSSPEAVKRGLQRRLEAGLALPHHTDHILEQLETTDDGRIASSILDVSKDDYRVNTLATLAGPKTTGTLVDRFIACARGLKASPQDRQLSDEYHRLRGQVSATRPAPFLAALQERAGTDDPIAIRALSTLIALHGDNDERKAPLQLDPAAKASMIETLHRWVDLLLTPGAAGRYDLNELSNAIGRFGLECSFPI